MKKLLVALVLSLSLVSTSASAEPEPSWRCKGGLMMPAAIVGSGVAVAGTWMTAIALTPFTFGQSLVAAVALTGPSATTGLIAGGALGLTAGTVGCK